MTTKDCNGAELEDGDNVKLARDLKVKGASINLKRGTVVKNIRLSGNEDQVECRVGKATIVLKTQFLQKA